MQTKSQRKRPHNFFTLTEVQALLGVKSRKTIIKYIKSGQLSAYKLGGTRWRIAREDFQTFLKKQQVDGNNFKEPNTPLEERENAFRTP